MKHIIVLGAGMVGSAIAIDLSSSFQITLADFSKTALDLVKSRCPKIDTLALDVTDSVLLKNTLKTFDMVVCAVPGHLGYQTLTQIIEAEKDVVDISFFPENALELNALAKSKGVTAIVDCGVAPGMDNIILGHYDTQMTISHFECLVGGLPKVKTWPFAYKAPFSPIDVIEEYTRPARYVAHGKLVTRPALTDCEHVEFDKIGTLESFNSDGLRSIIYTMPHIPHMKEKTLRYPGHVEYIKVLKSAGFFDTDPVQVEGKTIRPLDLTNQLLFKAWRLAPDEEELTIMRVTIKGQSQDGQQATIIYELYDEYNHHTQTSSMARTTGYTATGAVQLILQEKFNQKGIFPPELVGKVPGCFEFIIKHLADRNVIYKKQVI